MLARAQGRVHPHGAPKLGRSGPGEDFKAEASQEPAAYCQDTFTCATPFFVLFFLFSSYHFLDDTVWGQIPSHLQLHGSCAV